VKVIPNKLLRRDSGASQSINTAKRKTPYQALARFLPARQRIPGRCVLRLQGSKTCWPEVVCGAIGRPILRVEHNSITDSNAE